MSRLPAAERSDLMHLPFAPAAAPMPCRKGRGAAAQRAGGAGWRGGQVGIPWHVMACWGLAEARSPCAACSCMSALWLGGLPLPLPAVGPLPMCYAAGMCNGMQVGSQLKAAVHEHYQEFVNATPGEGLAPWRWGGVAGWVEGRGMARCLVMTAHVRGTCQRYTSMPCLSCLMPFHANVAHGMLAMRFACSSMAKTGHGMAWHASPCQPMRLPALPHQACHVTP